MPFLPHEGIQKSILPSYPVQSPCSLSHVREGFIQSPVEQSKQPLARSSCRRKPFVPNTMASQVVLIHKQSPSLRTQPRGPGKLGSTAQSDTQHIPSATRTGSMSKFRTPGLCSHASDQEKTLQFHLPVCFLQECWKELQMHLYHCKILPNLL